MLQFINDLPPRITGLHAFADVSEMEYENTLTLSLDAMVKRSRKINFILVLETDIANFTPGAWCGNIKIGLKYFFRWNRVAIVTDQKRVLGYNDLFKYIIPGKFRKFPLDQLAKALSWVSDK